jgi:hypothetical protein
VLCQLGFGVIGAGGLIGTRGRCAPWPPAPPPRR